MAGSSSLENASVALCGRGWADVDEDAVGGGAVLSEAVLGWAGRRDPATAITALPL
jgi:hypothetical protein